MFLFWFSKKKIPGINNHQNLVLSRITFLMSSKWGKEMYF